MIDINKVVFVNVAPMKEYRGHEGEIPKHGGTYWSEYGFGHEMFNFLNDDGYCYGHSPRGITIGEISKDSHADENGTFIDHVLVIFTSTGANGRCITGFYLDARLYQGTVESSSNKRFFDNSILKNAMLKPFAGIIGYEMICRAENAYLIPETERNFKAPNARENNGVGFGQFPVWYANSDKNLQYKKVAVAHIQQIISATADAEDRALQAEVDRLILENNAVQDNSGVMRRFGDGATKPKKAANATEKNGNNKYVRDSRKSWQAVKDASYACEINSAHPTFKRKDGVHDYTEAHHLIPTKNQDRFPDIDLDNPANIVSLCSNCHNWIHYGEGAEMLIKKLHNQRKPRLKSAGLNMSIEEMLELQ